MPDKKTSNFIKNEYCNNISNDTWANYTGIGHSVSTPELGKVEGLLAIRISDTTLGGFGEVKYTTPKIKDSEWSFESRTRVHIDESQKDCNLAKNLTQRLAFKGIWDSNMGVSLYEIMGINSKISLQGEGMKSITPTSITGVNCNVSKNISIYGEVEASKTYNIAEKKWNNFSPATYLGLKIAF